MNFGIVYYTNNKLDPFIMETVQKQILKSKIPVVSVSLVPIEFGRNIVLKAESSKLTMFKQILLGLEDSHADIIFFCEHDVLYHLTHFEFVPARDDVYYYNNNVYKVRYPDGKAITYICNQTSGLCAYRKLLLKHYQERVRRVELEGYSNQMGYEPGTHNREGRVDDFKAETWWGYYPNIDIRHDKNLTPSRWTKDEFRNSKFTVGFKEVTSVPGWGEVADEKIVEILKNV
jgi:hypothetical protein